MAIKLESVKVDLQRDVDGDWIIYPKWSRPDDLVKFHVSNFEHPRFKVARDALIKRLAREYGAGVPDDVVQKEWGMLYAEYLLHGWSGISDVQYTSEIAVERLTNPVWRELYKAVEWCIGKAGEVQAEFVDVTVKN